MATKRFSTAVGDHDTDVVVATGAATVTASIELTVDMATSIVTDGSSTRTMTREEALLGLERIARKIESGNWPL